MKKTKTTRFLALILCLMLCITALASCSDDVYDDNTNALTYNEAVDEITSLMTKVDVTEIEDPTLDIYSDEVSTADALSDISTYNIVVQGKGDINIEIAGATEMTSDESPDNWLTLVAEKFNKQKYTIDGKSVSVTVRQITSGEVVTYMLAGAYQPEVFIPSASMWGDMLSASGFTTNQITDKLVGNTAGILMKNSVYDDFIETYGEASLSNIITAAIAGDIVFAYPNPYTSTTGLNGVGGILAAFDPDDPLSNTAITQLQDYQKTSPPVAYTTAVLRNQAAKGIINTMLMEEQAYINTTELKDYTYIPFGIRHDHPVYTFDYCSDAEVEAAELFVEYCLSDENQKLATEKGFNRHDDYVSQDPGFSGTDWINAQKIWKENKSGGNPIVAVFIADTSDSMRGEPINSLKSSLVSASTYISEDNYIGLVSYDSDVTINLPIAKFDATQRAYFSGEVKNLSASGNTATYDAVLAAMQMLVKAKEDIPDAQLMLFLLTDGAKNTGYSLNRITPIVDGLEVPVYTIAYNYGGNKELETLSNINEATALNADSDNIVNQLRNLFNTQM